MTLTKSRLALTVDALILIAIYIGAVVVARSSLALSQPGAIGSAILIDLTFSCVIAHYLLGIRLGGLPSWTILPVLGSGVALATMLVGEEVASGKVFVILLAIAELSAAAIVIFRFRKIVLAFRRHQRAGLTGLNALESALAEVLPSRLAAAVRLELELLATAVLGWFRRPVIKPGERAFTIYRSVGWFPLVGCLIFLSAAEGALIHFWLVRSDWTTTALLVSALHVYGICWLIGDAQAMRLEPIIVDGRQAQIRIGLRWQVEFQLDDIEKAITPAPAAAAGFSLVLFGQPNVVIELNRGHEVRGLFGIRRSARTLLLKVDQPEHFVEALLRVA